MLEDHFQIPFEDKKKKKNLSVTAQTETRPAPSTLKPTGSVIAAKPFAQIWCEARARFQVTRADRQK